MSQFDNFDDSNTEGQNVNITDHADPSKKAGVTNTDVNVSDISDVVSAPIHTLVGTSAVRIDSPVLANRKELDITVSKDVFIGYTNAVTTTSGWAFRLRKGQAIGLAIGPNVQLWAISDTAGVATTDVVVAQGARA